MKTMAPVDPIAQSPVAEKRNWRPIVLAALASAVVVAAVAIWWVGIRDTTTGPVSVAVTGVISCDPQVDGPDNTWVLPCAVVASDARLTGTVSATPLPSDTGDALMTWVLSNDGGMWEGTVTYNDPRQREWDMTGVLSTEDYGGLQYRFHGQGANGIAALTGTLESIPAEADPTVTYDGTTATYEGPTLITLDADQFTATLVNASEHTAYFIVAEVAPDFWGIEAHRTWRQRWVGSDSAPPFTSAVRQIMIGPGVSMDWSIRLSGDLVLDVVDIDVERGYSAALITVNR